LLGGTGRGGSRCLVVRGTGRGGSRCLVVRGDRKGRLKKNLVDSLS